MKRLVFSLVVALIMVFGVFAQEGPYVEDINGHDWREWSFDQKLGYMQGFYSAYTSIWERMIETMDVTSEQELAALEEVFHINYDVFSLITEIDAYYQQRDSRDFRLYYTLMWLAGKDYWNQ